MGGVRGTVVLAAAAIDQGGEQWIEVIPTCEKQRNGRWFFTVTDDDLATYARSISDQPGLIPVDYDHTEGTGTIAAGWFTGQTMIVRAGELNPADEKQDHDSLWALVKWTPRAAKEITDGHYKRLSPEFTFHDKDPKSGLLSRAKAIVASTLTNRPFFTQLAPVGADTGVVWDRHYGYQSIRDKLAAALNPPAADGDPSYRYYICDIDVSGLKALVEDSQDASTYVVPFTLDDAGEPTPADRTDWVEAEEQWVAAARAAESSYNGRVATTKGAPQMEITVLAKSLGLSETATDDEVQAALSAAVEKAGKVDDLEQKVQTLEAAAGDKTEVETLREELATERTKRIAREREDLFATAIREGRMAPSEKEALAEAFGEDTEKLDKVLAARPKNATIAREHGSGGDAKADDAPVDEEVAKSFTTAEGDAPDAEQLSTHQKALAILAKDVYTEDEYMAAYAKAERGETVKG